MSNSGPTKEEYDTLIYRLATLESQLGQARKFLEVPASSGWRRRFWGMGAKAAVVVLVVVCFSGCAPTVADIRNSHPDRMMSSPYPPKKVANCVAYEAQGEAGTWNRSCDSATIIEQNGIYRLLITVSPAFGGNVNVGEVTIKPDGNGGSLIEYRSTYIVQGLIDKFWEHVKKCADTPPAPEK